MLDLKLTTKIRTFVVLNRPTTTTTTIITKWLFLLFDLAEFCGF